jgi:hypothetical protein
VFQEALQSTTARTNWTKEEISEIYNTPLMELSYAAVRTTFLQDAEHAPANSMNHKLALSVAISY